MSQRLQRIWDRTQQIPSGCIEWMGPKVRGGYGRIKYNGQMQLVHRVIWQLIKGPIPKGLEVCHRCDNPPCINSEHLFLSDHTGNMRDCVQKGRHNTRFKGQRNPHSKLSPLAVYEIRASRETNAILAERFGVVPQLISRIRLRQIWRDL